MIKKICIKWNDDSYTYECSATGEKLSLSVDGDTIPEVFANLINSMWSEDIFRAEVRENIVRCKNCIHWNKKLKRELYGEMEHACQKLRGRYERSIPYTHANDFCSRGKRR